MLRKAIFPALLCATLVSTACWKSKQQIYTTISNQSEHTLRSIEIDYPGGTYGISGLKAGATQQQWSFLTTPCHYAVRFVDENGKQYASKTIDLGSGACPNGVLLTINKDLTVTGAPAH